MGNNELNRYTIESPIMTLDFLIQLFFFHMNAQYTDPNFHGLYHLRMYDRIYDIRKLKHCHRLGNSVVLITIK